MQKLEIDVNPPSGSGFDRTFLEFPLDFAVAHQDLPSNFALKIHALLCRPYVKGRDWYDFNWYVKQNISPNLSHLQAALRQTGPWKNLEINVSRNWIAHTLSEKILEIDWSQTTLDVERFVGAAERQSLQPWGTDFFLSRRQS